LPDITQVRFVGKLLILWTFTETKLIQFMCEQYDKPLPLNFAHAMLYPQYGDRITTTDFVTSRHPVYFEKEIANVSKR